MTLRKLYAKPVTIEGIEWTGTNLDEIKAFCNGMANIVRGHLCIETLEGTSKAHVNDWILRGTHGEFYPVKPEILERKYEIGEELFE